MCTRSQILNSLECYVDDLVDCFEDYVEKSLFIISLLAGALIVMLGYLLKVISERTQTQGGQLRAAIINSAQNEAGGIGFSGVDDQKSISSMSRNSVNSVTMPNALSDPTMPYQRQDSRKTTSAAANTYPVSSVPSIDEQLIRNIGLSSCSKSCSQSKQPEMRNNSPSRLTLPSLPICAPNQHLSIPRPCSKNITNRTSCCSICCAEDDMR